MNKYIFLLAWVSGSDSACGESTNVATMEDLEKEFFKDNEHIFALEIHADSEAIAYALGCKTAFFNNYTANDSTSTLLEFPATGKLPRNLPVVSQKD